MNRQVIKPQDQNHWLTLRTADITSTESPALFGLSPYMTHFELWHRKAEATVVELESNERMKWGNRLQDSIAHGIAEDQGWQIRKMNEYIRLPDLRMGSSFDFCIQAMKTKEDFALLEIKNVDSLQFKDGWLIDDNGIEAPPHIEIQVQHQLAVSGLDHAYIGALIGGNQVILTKRERDQAIIKKIQEKVAIFWETINNKIPPKPDFTKDAEFISKLYGFAEPGKLLPAEGRADIAAAAMAYKRASDAVKIAEGAKDAAKAQLLTMIGTAEKVTGDGFTISAGVIGPTRVEAFDKKGYRNFRVFFKKEKTL